MKFYDGYLLWNRIKNDDGTPWKGRDTLDEYFCYLRITDHRKNRFWGYHALPYDCQGHEMFGFGRYSIQWSTLSSFNRAYYGFWHWLPWKKKK